MLSRWADTSLRRELSLVLHERNRLQARCEILDEQVSLLTHAHEVNNKMLLEMAYTHGVRTGEKSAS